MHPPAEYLPLVWSEVSFINWWILVTVTGGRVGWAVWGGGEQMMLLNVDLFHMQS
jgi:hypothetical protein